MPTPDEIRARYESARLARKRARARKARTREEAIEILQHDRAGRRRMNSIQAPSTPVGRALDEDVRRAFPEAARDLNKFRGQFVRDVDDLRVVGKSPRAKLVRVASHLLARYPVPPCVLDVFAGGDTWQQGWFVDLGAGQSVRAVARAFHLSKRAAHQFRSAPRALGPAGGAWWAKLRAMHAPAELAFALANLRLFRGEVSEAFLDQAAAWFVTNAPKRADLRVLGLYLEGCWREDRDYNLKGKRVNTLAREAHFIYGDGLASPAVFPASGVDEVRIPVTGQRGLDAFRFIELKSPHALRVEGTRMHHCVYEYRHRCAAGAAAIFSLRERSTTRTGRARQTQEKTVVTLEVRPKQRQIVQARAPHNREPTDARWEAIQRFAALNDLQVTCLPPQLRG